MSIRPGVATVGAQRAGWGALGIENRFVRTRRPPFTDAVWAKDLGCRDGINYNAMPSARLAG